jgi:hypothetical protein
VQISGKKKLKFHHDFLRITRKIISAISGKKKLKFHHDFLRITRKIISAIGAN